MSKSAGTELARLVREVRGCRICRDVPEGPPLPHEPNPVLRPSATARICICSQAPGVRVHASGTPFTDPSGDRLRAWLRLSSDEFYDQRRVAIVPMGFCFPGHDAAGGDLPPRRECARAWHARLFALMPQLELILAVGGHAQHWHMAEEGKGSMTAIVSGLAAAVAGQRHAPARCPAPPLLAQQRLAGGQSMVRGGNAAAAAA